LGQKLYKLFQPLMKCIELRSQRNLKTEGVVEGPVEFLRIR